MGVTLAKGGNVSLSKAAPNLTQVLVGLGWDARSTTGADLRPRRQRAAVPVAAGCSATSGSSSTTTSRAPTAPSSTPATTSPVRARATTSRSSWTSPRCRPTCDKIVFPVSIHDADNRGQTFGQVSNAFIRVVNQADGQELARYDLTEDASTETAMIFGELYRYGGEWKFRAVGQGYASGLRGIALDFGVNVS